MSQPKRVTPSPADVSFKGAFEKGATNPESNQEMMVVIMTNLEKVKEEQAKAATAAP